MVLRQLQFCPSGQVLPGQWWVIWLFELFDYFLLLKIFFLILEFWGTSKWMGEKTFFIIFWIRITLIKMIKMICKEWYYNSYVISSTLCYISRSPAKYYIIGIIVKLFTNHLNHFNQCNPGSDNKAEQIFFHFLSLNAFWNNCC